MLCKTVICVCVLQVDKSLCVPCFRALAVGAELGVRGLEIQNINRHFITAASISCVAYGTYCLRRIAFATILLARGRRSMRNCCHTAAMPRRHLIGCKSISYHFDMIEFLVLETFSSEASSVHRAHLSSYVRSSTSLWIA
jgi:hypothetical protein